MTGAVCPSCGVAVVPGYVRCPKCHKPLPQRKSAVVEGGTAVREERKFPVAAVIGAVVLAVAVIAFFGLRKSDDKQPTPPAGVVAPEQQQREVAEPTQAAQPAATAPAQPTRPNPQTVATELQRALKKQRLWSTVTIIGDHVDVQSSSCSDPAMGPLLDNAAPSFKAAGLTKLRCLEQSGRVVSNREL
jgi:hypothetical protein